MGNAPSDLIGLSGQKKVGNPDDFIKACKEGRSESVRYIIDSYKDAEIDTGNIVRRGLTEAILENQYSVLVEIIEKRSQWTGGSSFSSNDKCVFGGFFSGSAISASVRLAIEQEGYISFLSLSLIQGVYAKNLECAKYLISLAKTGIRHELSVFLTHFRSIVFMNKGVEIDPLTITDLRGYGSSYSAWSILFESKHLTQEVLSLLVGYIEGHHKQDVFIVRLIGEHANEVMQKVLSKVCLPILLGFEKRHLVKLPVDYNAKQDSSYETYLPHKRERRVFECPVLEAFLACPLIDVNREDSGGHTLLHYACFLGYVDMVKTLLAHKKTDLNPLDCNLVTPLVYAYKNSHKEIVSLLISDERIDNRHACRILQEEDLTKRSSYLNNGKRYLNALCMACKYGRVSMVDTLLEKQQPHYFDNYSIRHSESESVRMNPLCISIRSNHMNITDKILNAYQKRFNSIQNALDKTMEIIDKTSPFHGKYGAVSVACHEKNMGVLLLLIDHIEQSRIGQWSDPISSHLFVAPLLANYGWDWVGDARTSADKINQCIITMGYERVVSTPIDKLDRIADYLPLIAKTEGGNYFEPLLAIVNESFCKSLKNGELRKLVERTCSGTEFELINYLMHGGDPPSLYTIDKCAAVMFLLGEKIHSCSVFAARCVYTIKRRIESVEIETIVDLLNIFQEYLQVVGDEDQTSLIYSLHSYYTHYIVHQARKGREPFLSCIDQTSMKHHIERHQRVLLLSDREPYLRMSISTKLPERGLVNLYNDEKTSDIKIMIQDSKEGARSIFLHRQVLISSVPILCSRIDKKPEKLFSENILYMLRFSYGMVEDIPEESLRVLQVLSSKYNFKKFSDYLNDCDNARIARVTRRNSHLPLETHSEPFTNVEL